MDSADGHVSHMDAARRPRHASLPQRIAALLIDLAIVMVAGAIPVLMLPASLSDDAVMLVAALPMAVYLLLRDGLPDGQSLGKRLLRIRVVDADGAACTAWRSIVRNLFLLTLSNLITLLLDYLFCWQSRYRRLGDLVAITAVVTVALYDTDHPQAAQE